MRYRALLLGAQSMDQWHCRLWDSYSSKCPAADLGALDLHFNYLQRSRVPRKCGCYGNVLEPGQSALNIQLCTNLSKSLHFLGLSSLEKGSLCVQGQSWIGDPVSQQKKTAQKRGAPKPCCEDLKESVWAKRHGHVPVSVEHSLI